MQAELGKPSILHPDKGKVNIFVDCSPTAEPTFEVGDLLESDQTETLKVTNSRLHYYFVKCPIYITINL